LTKVFLSEILPPIYERHFRRKAGFALEESGGPYVRFARAVMSEMKGPVSKHTIIAAIKEARSGKGPGYRKKSAH
jgi:hypothetical protein